MEPDLTSSHVVELRRGTIVLAALDLLANPTHGYALLGELADRGFVTDANTLYPLLRRLETHGLLVSEWDVTQSRPRKRYRTTADGADLAHTLHDEWRQLAAAIDRLEPHP